MKLTRHNGRSGRHGTYNPRHNDRRFDVENSEHIDAERARQNVYWDCYRGFTTHEFRENPEQPDFSFEEIERMYYYEHYGGHVEAQNARNEKTRHTERNRTVEDLLKNNKTCPEESIYQIGTMGESVPPDTLFSIVNEFYEEFERRFGSHIHILDWALHLDEGTPHIHERHVFDCQNRYGELCPQQIKQPDPLTQSILARLLHKASQQSGFPTKTLRRFSKSCVCRHLRSTLSPGNFSLPARLKPAARSCPPFSTSIASA